MSLIFKLLAVALLHAAFYVSYPGTGPYGDYYLAASLLVWAVFILFINTSTKIVRLISGLAGMAVNLAAFALIALALAATMPQYDKTSVLEKLQKGKYPDRATISSGLLRFGIHLDRDVGGAVRNVVDREAGKALKKLKED
ncbi:MAG TPA: hypothetical protein DCW72_08390 [Elusimicrobia bacterium]|nr:MAG: hypothetical protein A2X29_05110 [Elusimicrobia bacterium GWA2_64_40]OGR63978.1 MAG: hypothetical protein A2X30_07525 [Elusimicrobia bacterium GWB2_63_16]HAU90218.1 hypothetical protein [Elusimicrobiota bacterium]